MTNDEPLPYVVPMSADGRECLSFAPVKFSGWAAYFSTSSTDQPARVWLRFGMQGHDRLRSGAFELRELRLVGEAGLDFASGLLRDIPFRRIEAAVNQPMHRPALTELCPTDVMPVHPPEMEHVTPLWAYTPPAPQRSQRPRLRLTVPEGYRKPDSFYAAVAERFLWLATMSNAPAQELAAANDVPLTTVHRWVREAKARDLLKLPTRAEERSDG